MATVFRCNFDTEYDSDDWVSRYAAITTGEQKQGTSSVGIYSSGSLDGYFRTKDDGYGASWVFGQYYTELYARVYIQFNMYGTAGIETFFGFRASSTDLCVLKYDYTNSKIVAYDYSGAVGNYSFTYTPGEWYCIEMHFKRHATDGIFQVKVDTSLVIDYAGPMSTTYDVDCVVLRTKNNSAWSYYNYFDVLEIDDSDWIGPYLEGLDITFDNMTVAGTGEVDIEGSLSKTFQNMSVTGVVSNNFLDLPAKRASILQFQKPFAFIWPYPDAKISAYDRLHLLYLFSRDTSAVADADIVFDNLVLTGYASITITGAGEFTFTNMLLNGYISEAVTMVYGPAWQSG